MLPLYDENPTNIVPIGTVFLIGSCVLCWLFIQGGGFSMDMLLSSICNFGTIPIEITGNSEVAVETSSCQIGGYSWQTLVSSMFLHGSWLHLIGNVWFLWIFGNNVEGSMGHMRFLLFFLLTGVVAYFSHSNGWCIRGNKWNHGCVLVALSQSANPHTSRFGICDYSYVYSSVDFFGTVGVDSIIQFSDDSNRGCRSGLYGSLRGSFCRNGGSIIVQEIS